MNLLCLLPFSLLALSAALEQSAVLSNGFLSLTVTASPAGTCISSLSFNLSLAGVAQGWTPNLLSTSPGFCGSRAWNGASGTALEVQGVGVLVSAGGTLTAESSTAAVVAGVSLGSSATEEWRISLAGATLSWEVARVYTAGGTALSDQAPALWLQSTTGGYSADALRDAPGASSWTSATQMPSFLSLDDSLLDPSTGRGYAVANFSRVAVLGDATRGDVRRIYLSPAGVAAHVSLSDCRFGFYRPHSIFVQSLGFGAECAAGTQGGVSFSAGDSRTVALAVELRPTSQGHAYFDLTVPAGSPAEQLVATLQTWAKIFQLPLGWINGNSPACETCLHETSIFPQLEGLFRLAAPPADEPAVLPSLPPLLLGRGQAPAATVQAATAKHISFYLSSSVNLTSGYMAPRWSVVNGNDWGMGGTIIDQFPHTLLAVYWHAVNTGDRATVAGWMSAVDAIARYMLTEMLLNETALLTNTNPKADGVANHSLEDNWLDDIRFGWHDAIVGLYAVDAFRALGDLKTWLQDEAGAAAAYAVHSRAVAAYNAAYWDEGAGMYRDWVDTTGRARTYFYTWQNFYAVELGVASAAQASAIMDRAEGLYAGLRAQFNVTAEELWCTPTNLIPLDPADITVNFDSEFTFPHYENGDCFQWHLGLEALALSRVRGASAAYDKLSRAAGVFDASRLWGQRYSWTAGRPMGADVITDGFFAVYGGLFGALGVRVSLLHGVTSVGPAAPQLEGANFTIGVLGSDVVVAVQGGIARVLPTRPQ
jgi:hypothetical protein